MRRNIITEVAIILNDSSDLKEKRMLLGNILKSRRSNNRKFVNEVINILCCHLPFNHKQSLYIDNIKIDNNTYIFLDKLLSVSSFTYFNAICSEILWILKRDFKFAIKALDSYNKEFDNPTLSYFN